jgi:hypothetical protein
MSITIELSQRYLTARDEMCIAKQTEVRQRNQHDRFVTPMTRSADVQGFTAEAAWAQMLNISYSFRPYNPTNDDVAGIQVRSTKNKNGHLMIYKKDVPGTYVLGIVNDTFNVVEFVGWSTYERVVKPENYKTQLGTYQLSMPAYCVNQSELKSFLDWPPRNEVL